MAMRLACTLVVIVSTLLALNFDRLAFKAEIGGNQNVAPGDYLEYRQSVLSAEQHYRGGQDGAAYLAYPPPFMLFVTPFAGLDARTGYVFWVAVTALVLALAARWAGIGWLAIAIGLLSSPALFCAICGQSGMLVSAFLLLAYGFAGRRQIVSGLAVGCVIIKPQFGLLLPVCFLALRAWRGILVAMLGMAGLALLTTICFGWSVWFNHQTHRMAGAASLLSVRWFSQMQANMVSPYVFFQSFGASLLVAALLQALVSAAAILACWRLWRTYGHMPMQCLAPGLCLTFLATPYAYLYDLPALALAVTQLALSGQQRGMLALMLLSASLCLYSMLSILTLHSFGAALIALLLLLTWPRRTDSVGKEKPA